MTLLHDYAVAFGAALLQTVALCVALWLGVSLLSYADKSKKQP